MRINVTHTHVLVFPLKVVILALLTLTPLLNVRLLLISFSSSRFSKSRALSLHFLVICTKMTDGRKSTNTKIYCTSENCHPLFHFHLCSLDSHQSDTRNSNIGCVLMDQQFSTIMNNQWTHEKRH